MKAYLSGAEIVRSIINNIDVDIDEPILMTKGELLEWLKEALAEMNYKRSDKLKRKK